MTRSPSAAFSGACCAIWDLRSLWPSDGREALQHLDTHAPPDVVTVNWQMPNLDGIGFLQAFRGPEQFRGIPVIMVSSEDHPLRIAQAKAAGADAYVVKPLTPEVLSQTLRRVGVSADRVRSAGSPRPAQRARVPQDPRPGG